MIVYGAKEIMTLLGVSRSKAYDIIRELRDQLEQDGKMSPISGKVQARWFCERTNLDLAECQRFLKDAKNEEVS